MKLDIFDNCKDCFSLNIISSYISKSSKIDVEAENYIEFTNDLFLTFSNAKKNIYFRSCFNRLVEMISSNNNLKDFLFLEYYFSEEKEPLKAHLLSNNKKYSSITKSGIYEDSTFNINKLLISLKDQHFKGRGKKERFGFKPIRIIKGKKKEDIFSFISYNDKKVYFSDDIKGFFSTNKEISFDLNNAYNKQLKEYKIKNIEEGFVSYIKTLFRLFPDCTEFVYFPASTINIRNNTIRSEFLMGAVMVASQNVIPINQIIALWNFTQNIINQFSNQYQFLKLIESRNNAVKSATHAAISQIMARNMSHNLGSHVLIKVAGDKDSESEKLKPLLSYIQKRMEFIANIAYMPSFQNNYTFETLIKPLNIHDKNEDLLYIFNNISGKEEIKSENLKLNFNIKKNSFVISIPNGSLGFHAFYIIVENIIRNAVKHHKDEDLPRDANNNISIVYNFKIENDKIYKDYYKITISDNIKNDNIDNLKDIISKSITENGILRQGGWGVLEMKICAAYLAGLPLIYLDEASKEVKLNINGNIQKFPPVLEVNLNNEHNLVHSFYFQKPKLLAYEKNLNIIEKKTLGIESFNISDSFHKFGSKHTFFAAKYDPIDNHCKNHEKDTNQRTLFIKPFKEKQNISEDFLWSEYIKQKVKSIDNFFIKTTEINDKLKINKKKKFIILDNHHYWGEKNFKLLENIFFYEAINSSSPSDILRRSVASNNLMAFNKKARAQIIEMASTFVMLIDERVQKEIEKTTESVKNPYYSNLFIPSISESNLDNPDNNTIIEYWEKIKKKKGEIQLDYLIIHRSLCGKNKFDDKELIKELNPLYTVYVSGGGLPPKLKPNSYYLPFEVMNQCVCGNSASKFALVNILKSLRKNSNYEK